MIQRKQTVFLFLALVATICCLCMPVGTFVQQGMGTDSTVFNLWMEQDGNKNFAVWPLFVVLLLSCPVCLMAIFAFRNRMLQSKLCVVGMALQVVWGSAIFFFASTLGGDGASFHVGFASAFPIVALVLYFMARRGILADEKLVRAADRIR